MKRNCLMVLLVGAVIPGVAHAQTPDELTLSLSEALRYAAENSPVATEAQSRVGLTDARIEEATISNHGDPFVELGAGPRFGTSTTPNVNAAVGQTYELSRRRAAEVTLAQRHRDVVRSEVEDAHRTLFLEVGRAYLQVLHAERRLEVSRSDTEVAERALSTAQKRFDAGETDRLEVNSAKVAHGRTVIEEQLWRGRLEERRSVLRSFLGVPDGTTVTLQSTLERPKLPPLSELREAASERPDLKAFRDTIERERARAALASTLVHPDLGVRLRYGREEGANIVMAALSLSLPFYPRGKGVEAEAVARTAMARESLRRVTDDVAERLPAAYSRWERLRAAEVKFRNEVLPLVTENQEMARKAYEAGAIDLPELLALRREIVAARERYVDLLRESAMVDLEVQSLAGILGERGDSQ